MGYKRSKLKKILQAPTAKIRYNVVDNLIPDELRDGAILDIGCGEIPYFLSRIKFKSKRGFDPICKWDTSYADGAYIHRGKAPNFLIGYMADTFDVITIISVIEHFDSLDIQTIFNEIYRILKSGGRFIMTCLNPKADWLLHLMRWDIEHENYYNIMDIEIMLYVAGFCKIREGKFEFGLNRWLYADKEG